MRATRRRGGSIVEIIVAIALLALATAVLIPLAVSGFSGVFTSGKKAMALYEAQIQMEQAIVEQPSSSEQMTFVFDDVQFDVEGERVTLDVEYEHGKMVTVNYFVPAR